MPKIKIIEAGWAGYTGYLGSTEFVDGVSVNDISPLLAQQLSSVVSCRDVATDKDHNPAQIILSMADVAMDQDMPLPDLAQIAASQVIEHGDAPLYTREALETLAEQGGIGALRELADPVGIKSNRIVTLIEAMLKAGLRHSVADEPEAPAPEAPAEPVAEAPAVEASEAPEAPAAAAAPAAE
jgi:hypothetical protein